MRFLVMFLLSMSVSAMSFAGQKCVTFGNWDTLPNEINAESSESDWSVVYSHITINGIGVCAETVGEMGDVADVLTFDSSTGGLSQDNNNIYCWCRMLYPAVSAWISLGQMGDMDACIDYCSVDCADVAFMPELRSAMLENLRY